LCESKQYKKKESHGGTPEGDRRRDSREGRESTTSCCAFALVYVAVVHEGQPIYFRFVFYVYSINTFVPASFYPELELCSSLVGFLA